MTSQLWIDRPHHVVLQSRFGFSLLITGFATKSESLEIDDIQVKQGSATLNAASAVLVTNLLLPLELGRVPGRFSSKLGKSFALMVEFPPNPGIRSGIAALEAQVRHGTGEGQRLRLASVLVEEAEPRPFDVPVGLSTIGIAMATYNPDPMLFQRQVESIRAQTHPDWVCVISDDCSDPSLRKQITAIVGDDPRFRLAPGTRNLGFYRNFERAIAMLPPECNWVAFSDQDDEWEPEKLATLLSEGKNGALLVYSDMSVYSRQGKRLSDTFWITRRNEVDDIAALTVANAVTGMATLINSCLLKIALPLPSLPGTPYHDHWFVLCAYLRGGVRYIDKPLVRYVQHGGNHTGIFKRPPTVTALLGRSLAVLAHLATSLVVPRLRRSLDRQIEHVGFWGVREPLRLRMMIEALLNRTSDRNNDAYPRNKLKQLARSPHAAAFQVEWRTLNDPYRRHMVAGLFLGWILSAGGLIGFGVRGLINRSLQLRGEL